MERIEKVKNHIREHKEVYLAAAGGAFVGAVGVLLLRDSPAMISIKEIMNFKYKSPTTAISQIILPALGDPGNVVEEIESHTFFNSQGLYGRLHGIKPSEVSRHLRGELPDLNGKHLRVVGKAGHPIAA
jgi:hypothetical protein